ncbi:DUF6355 family natural product biosynthesis protein [Streptomyces changanensis]|uniref:DUF6355 family natural product biosynthesis protein n=1 Tax=Streptomyces changanensis TaxID=2964669 RepID=A0ABY5NE75_9ACTN|nr:DUF6355 family natural product biosynthesis protein [Streptomyces changanensis]UUS34331.1 DUF6355 family natural product biosynthesis protein [Streptomyces changanensis]
MPARRGHGGRRPGHRPGGRRRPSGALACGWDPDAASGRAYYNHCTSDGSWIWIRVERHGASGFDKCVGPNRTYLGSTSVIRYAWYKGGTC